MRTPTILLLFVLLPTIAVSQATPQAVADELLAADRAFSAASAKTDVVSGLSAMFAEDVVMPNPAGLAYGKAKAIEALRANPINTGSSIEWIPVRAGVSADGRHGFTAGFMKLRQANGSVMPLKYLTYWEKQTDGWRALAYKRGRGHSDPPTTMMSPVLPKQLVTPSTDAKLIAGYADSVAEVEAAFSRDAQTMGIGPAFKHYGSPDAINLGPPEVPGFRVGNEDIAGGVGPPDVTGSPVSWGADKVFVASSGDLGVSIGFIRQNKPDPAKPAPPNAFFTIWRRDSVKDPWRYIAE